MATMHRFSVDTLMDATRRLIEGMGTPPAIAEAVAEMLVGANAAGHDSHGIIRIPAYFRQLEGGSLLPAAEPSVVRDTVATAVVDGGHGWGHYATRWCMDLAMAKAREAGIGAVTLLRSNHIGRLGAFVERAASAGFIGLVTTGSGARNSGCALPPGGTERVLGTNPMAFGVPTGWNTPSDAKTTSNGAPFPSSDGPPFVIDFATTVVAEGKIQVARSKGTTLPPACILDKQGRPSIQPSDFYDGGSLLYAGGHKGYGLSLLTALLSGLSGAFSVEPWRMGGVFVQAIDVSAFQAPEEYRAAAAAMLTGVKSVGRAEGVDEILVPGEPEQRSRADRLANGIEVPDTVWSQVLTCAEKLGVAMPTADD